MLDTLSLCGWIVVSILELFEEEHCLKSIIYFTKEANDNKR
nr:MAG TPA: hypothetical protein [Caudoviricetes sp.]